MARKQSGKGIQAVVFAGLGLIIIFLLVAYISGGTVLAQQGLKQVIFGAIGAVIFSLVVGVLASARKKKKGKFF